MSPGAGIDRPVNAASTIYYIGDRHMNVAVKATESSSPVTYPYVKTLALTEDKVTIIQETTTEVTTRTFDFGYSVTITK